MLFIMAVQITSPCESPEIFEEQQTIGVWLHDIQVKVDEVSVIVEIALGQTDSMGIMTCRTGGPSIKNMPFVLAEAFITADAVPVMTLVTQGVFIRTFLRVIRRRIVSFQDMLIYRTVRPSGAVAGGGRIIIAVMAVSTINHALLRIGG